MSNARFRQRLRGPSRAAVLAFIFASPPAQRSDTQQVWIEITSPHFVVVSNAGEGKARDVAQRFEQIRSVYQTTLPKVRVDPGQPITILAVKNEKSLKELLPHYWEKKGQIRPAGIFQHGPGKHYVALRLDVSGPIPYSHIYHEYFHLLNLLNTPDIPAWLNEGLAEFWGNTMIHGAIVEMGYPSRSHLQLLRAEDLLPLEILFAVDHSSPYYSHADKAPMFYAQSWALTHYLMIGDRTGEGKKGLTSYMNLVQAEDDPGALARRAFGSLKALERKLDEYVRSLQFPIFRTEAPAGLDPKEFRVRDLSLTDSLAVRGDFMVHGQRPADARPLLQQALALDPDLAQAHESMGFLHYREGNRDEAARWFGKAAVLDPERFLAQYFHAALRLEKGVEARELEAIAQSLRRAIELNPRFGPAYAQLASVYGRRGENLEEALALAEKAVDLEPTAAWIYVHIGQIQMMMGKTEEARKVGEQALRLAKSSEEERFARGFLERVQEHEAFLTRRAPGERPPREPEAEAVPRSRQAEPLDDAASQKTPESDLPPWFGQPTQEVRGVLSGLQCLPGGALDFIVSVGDQKYVLHATSPKSVLILENGQAVFRQFRCGPQSERVIARFVPASDAKPGSEVKGTLASLEFLKEPK